jgi:hypothetical protein
MILVLSVMLGVGALMIRTQLGGRRLSFPKLRATWVVLVAFAPQGLTFFLPFARERFAPEMVAVSFVTSLVFLLGFSLANWKRTGFWALNLGLLLNLVVIALNGGWMPISPETLVRLVPDAPADTWVVGERLGVTKDIILSQTDTYLWWLSDRFVFPEWLPYRVAFSVGDVLIAIGAFRFFWSLGDQE